MIYIATHLHFDASERNVGFLMNGSLPCYVEYGDILIVKYCKQCRNIRLKERLVSFHQLVHCCHAQQQCRWCKCSCQGP